MSACMRVQRDAAEEPRVQIALSGADRDVEVAEPAERGVERRHSQLLEAPVEDDRGVRPTLVRCDPFDDRLAADLLLGVEREANVHRELACGRESARGLDEDEELGLVVRHAARIEPAVALGELEGRRLPEVERIGWLNVEVRVTEHRGRGLGTLGGSDLADDERSAAVPGDDVDGASCVANPVRHPAGRGDDIARMSRIGADRRDGDQLGELVSKLLVGRAHGRAV